MPEIFMLKMLQSEFLKSIYTLLILTSFCFGQISSGGTVSGAGGIIGGGKADSLLKKEVTSVFDKKIFTGLGQRTAKSNSTPKTASSKTVAGKKSSTKSKNPTVKSPKVLPPLMPSPSYNAPTALNFQPIGDTGFDEELADMLTQQADHRAILLTLFRETKKAYNVEAKKLGRENNIALATTFFLTACISVYHQAPNPTDEATNALYESMANSMLETPETAQLSNQEKQLASDKMIYLGGLILGGYLISKESGDQQTMQAYRKIAANCFRAFTNLEVENYEFSKTGLKLKS